MKNLFERNGTAVIKGFYHKFLQLLFVLLLYIKIKANVCLSVCLFVCPYATIQVQLFTLLHNN
jgi:hypothetical protein